MIGKAVLVTGAARRVGRSIAFALHAAGANVVVHYRQAKTEAQSIVSAMNEQRSGSAYCLQADLLNVKALSSLIKESVLCLGRLDALVNNASSFFPTPFEDIDQKAWDDLVGSNLKAPLFLAQAAAPYLKASKGAIVNITDIHAERPLLGYSLYCVAKAGLLGLTRSLAVELAPEVRVNAVAPGAILWPDDGAFDADMCKEIVEHTLLKRQGTPEEIAQAVLYLLSGASYMTGQVINIDGGRTAHL